MVDAAVIGVGPDGLSVAAHLRGLRVPFRTFGKRMVMWRKHMPTGIVLTSRPCKGNLPAPRNALPIPVRTGARRTNGTRSSDLRLPLNPARGAPERAADHMIAATGYKADIRRLPFLKPLRGEIVFADGSSLLDQRCQATTKSLYFTGFMSAATFGPSMRFVCGIRFAGWRVAGASASRVGARPVNVQVSV